jgi:hypothetical protein
MANMTRKNIIFNPKVCACLIAFNVTWDLCPSKMNKRLLVKEIPPCTNLLKKNNNSLNNKLVIHALDRITIHDLHLHIFM